MPEATNVMTERRLDTLEAMHRLEARTGRATMVTLAAELGISKVTVHGHLQILTRGGYVSHEPGCGYYLAPKGARFVKNMTAPARLRAAWRDASTEERKAFLKWTKTKDGKR